MRTRNSLRLHHALTGLALVATIACGGEETQFPRDLLGSWHADAPSYAGREFEVREDRIVVRAGEYSAPVIHMIRSVEFGRDAGSYEINYRESDGHLASIQLATRSGSKGQIELMIGASPIVWRRNATKGEDLSR